jgi:tRNA(Ile)-lysidine synthase
MGSTRVASRVIETIAEALAGVPLGQGEMILLALSGGADSVALLHALREIEGRFGFHLASAHFNHRLRADESDRDEAFVRDLCAQLDVQLTVESAQGLDSTMPNLEERARRLRYHFLRRAADQLGATRIALAHHAGDQTETVLMRLLRGTGVSGLKAMAEVGPGRLIRPMLGLERGEILAYLDAIGARFVNDSTNSSCAITRNRVRHELITALEHDYAPGLGRRLAELAAEMRSVDDLLTTMADRELETALSSDGALDIGSFSRLHPALAAALLRRFVETRIGGLRRIGRAHIEAMRRLCLEGRPSASVDLPGGWRAERRYATVSLTRCRPAAPSTFAVRLALDGPTTVKESGMTFRARVIGAQEASFPNHLCEAVFDADAIGGGLIARNFARGDRIRPLGLAGSRKVKNVFIDQKLPRALRSVLPVVTLANGEIAWIPGVARGSAAIITVTTRRVVHLMASRSEH